MRIKPPEEKRGASPDNPDGTPEAHLHSKAERTFDTVVYGGLGGVFNALFSVWAAEETKYGKGKRFFDKSSDWLAHRFAGGQPPAQLARTTQKIRGFNTMLALMFPGISLIVPMQMLENRKPKITRWIHENFTKSKDPEIQAQEEIALKQMETAPRQTWSDIIEGRIAGQALVFPIAWYGDEYISKIMHSGEQALEHGIRAVAPPAVQEKIITPKTSRWANLFMGELFYTALCTGSLYSYTHFIKPPRHRDEETNEPASRTADLPAMALSQAPVQLPPAPEQNVKKRILDISRQQPVQSIKNYQDLVTSESRGMQPGLS